MPVCAGTDIWFHWLPTFTSAPKVADVAAQYVEKVRINPGNYVDAARTFKHLEYTDEEYAQELQKIHDRFVPS